jgi:hypothetical protein
MCKELLSSFVGIVDVERKQNKQTKIKHGMKGKGRKKGVREGKEGMKRRETKKEETRKEAN